MPAYVLLSSNVKDIDLCTVYIATPKIKLEVLKPARVAPVVGQKVVAMSAPAGIYHPPTVPILQGRYSGPLPNGFSSIVTIPSKPGASGALVLNEEYRVVGVIYAVSISFEHVTLSVDYKTTRFFIKESLKMLKGTNMSSPMYPAIKPGFQL